MAESRHRKCKPSLHASCHGIATIVQRTSDVHMSGRSANTFSTISLMLPPAKSSIWVTPISFITSAHLHNVACNSGVNVMRVRARVCVWRYAAICIRPAVQDEAFGDD